MKQFELSKYNVRGGFLVASTPTLDSARVRARERDAYRRAHDEEVDDPEAIEIHNHVAMSGEPPDYSDRARDDEEPAEYPEDGAVVARFPADQFHFMTEGNEVVVYRGAGKSEHKTDIYEFGARDSRSRPPQTLRELNALNAAHYRQKGGRR
jgi:hypothetical protein